MLREGSKGGVFRRVDVENRVQPGERDDGQHSPAHTGQLRVSSRLPDNRIAARQFTDTEAIDKLHLREIENELLRATANGNVHEVSEFGVAVGEGEPSHCLHHDDAIDFPRVQLKSHHFITPRAAVAKAYACLETAYNCPAIGREVIARLQAAARRDRPAGRPRPKFIDLPCSLNFHGTFTEHFGGLLRISWQEAEEASSR